MASRVSGFPEQSSKRSINSRNLNNSSIAQVSPDCFFSRSLAGRRRTKRHNAPPITSPPTPPRTQPHGYPSAPPPKVTHDGYPGCRDVRQAHAGARRSPRAFSGDALSARFIVSKGFRNAVERVRRNRTWSQWRRQQPCRFRAFRAAPRDTRDTDALPKRFRKRSARGHRARGFRRELWIMYDVSHVTQASVFFYLSW